MQKFLKISDFRRTEFMGIIRENKEELEREYEVFRKNIDLDELQKMFNVRHLNENIVWREFKSHLASKGKLHLTLSKRRKLVNQKREELRSLEFEEIDRLLTDKINSLTRDLKEKFKEITWDDDIRLIFRIQSLIYYIEEKVEELMELDNVEDIDDFLILILLEDQKDFTGNNVLYYYGDEVSGVSNIDFYNVDDRNIAFGLLSDFASNFINQV